MTPEQKLTPEQHAELNAWLIYRPDKTPIDWTFTTESATKCIRQYQPNKNAWLRDYSAGYRCVRVKITKDGK